MRAINATTMARAALAVALAASAAFGQQRQPIPPGRPPVPPDTVFAPSEGRWRAEVTAWGWFVGMTGDVAAEGGGARVDASFVDLMQASDTVIAFAGRVEAGYGRIGGFMDGLYGDMGADNQSGKLGLGEVDINFRQQLLDFGLMYRVGEWAPPGDASLNGRMTTLDLYAGGRYYSIDLKIDPAIAALSSRTSSKSWIDPIVGAKLVLPVAEHWNISLNGDVGGFGVESDFTWSATAVLGYDFRLFRMPATVYGGYRAIGWDFSEGSPGSEFRWEVIEHGPILGFSLRF